jgi:hypothetical protein
MDERLDRPMRDGAAGDDMRLDGNALAGALSGLFAVDMTVVRGRCAGCGAMAPLGAQHLYRNPGAPGAVLRCAACGQALLVLVDTPQGCRLTLRGLRWLDVGAA